MPRWELVTDVSPALGSGGRSRYQSGSETVEAGIPGGKRRGVTDTWDTWDISSPRSWSTLFQQRRSDKTSGVYGHRQGGEEMGRGGPACAKAGRAGSDGRGTERAPRGWDRSGE